MLVGLLDELKESAHEFITVYCTTLIEAWRDCNSNSRVLLDEPYDIIINHFSDIPDPCSS